MDFSEVVRQAAALLQRQRRLTYRTLQRQFALDDDALQDLKDELLFSQPVVDVNGRGLVWTHDPARPEADTGEETEQRFQERILAVIGLLQRDRRVTYRTLQYLFRINDTQLEGIRQELRFRRLATDEGGEGLVWTVEAQPADQPAAAILQAPAPPEAATVTSAPGEVEPSPEESEPALHPPETSSVPTTPAPVRPAPDAERRQLTVMFCDLADSTQLSQQLDPEDLRDVIRAYQATSAEVIQRFDGTIAQHLGDGLLIYFGWPQAHENDAQRALHAGLGIVEAMTATLSPRLQQDRGVQLVVRIGIHTGPVVVGEMGGRGRREHLATGETVNIAARLEGLAAPNTVLISQATARLVQGTFALEELGARELKGVATAIPVFRVLGLVDTEPYDTEATPDAARFLVGRDEEIGLLQRRLEQSKEGLGQVVLVSGEAGIGNRVW